MTVKDFMRGINASSELVHIQPMHVMVTDRDDNPIDDDTLEIRSASFTCVQGVQQVELRCW